MYIQRIAANRFGAMPTKLFGLCVYYLWRMKRIGLLSDTHGHLPEAVFQYFAQCDEIWHAGDIGDISVADKLAEFKPFRAVYGNIDGTAARADYKEIVRFELEGVDVLMIHIGGYPGRYSPKVKAIMEVKPPTLFVCGHSHILKVMFDKKHQCLHLNPGAAGNHGFHKQKTLLRFSLAEGAIKDLEIIELGPR